MLLVSLFAVGFPYVMAAVDFKTNDSTDSSEQHKYKWLFKSFNIAIIYPWSSFTFRNLTGFRKFYLSG